MKDFKEEWRRKI